MDDGQPSCRCSETLLLLVSFLSCGVFVFSRISDIHSDTGSGCNTPTTQTHQQGVGGQVGGNSAPQPSLFHPLALTLTLANANHPSEALKCQFSAFQSNPGVSAGVLLSDVPRHLRHFGSKAVEDAQ